MAAVADPVAEADEITGAVVPPDTFTFTLTGRNGAIEIRLGNTRRRADGDPAGIVAEALVSRVDRTDRRVPDPDAGDQTVTLRPHDETTINVPVAAKSNGTSPITQLLTPAGEAIGDTVDRHRYGHRAYRARPGAHRPASSWCC